MYILFQARYGLRLVCIGALVIALTACQHLPDSMASLPFIQNSAADARAMTGPLPEARPREWPTGFNDVINMRAQAHGLVHMPAMQAYLNGLLKKIKHAAGVPDWPGEVYILASTGLEAMATASGNIYISQAWLSSIESEDEVVALLSHEFAHVYLHYHQLRETVPRFNFAADFLSGAARIAVESSTKRGWTGVDTAVVAYSASRDILSTAWARSQESAADMLGANILLKLGYSPDHGFRALLERLATWETTIGEQRKAARYALVETLRGQAVSHAQKQSAKQLASAAIPVPAALFDDLIEMGINAGFDTLDETFARATSSHPDILSRLERITLATEELSPETVQQEPATDQWLKAQRHRETAAILKQYALATQALENIDAPNALSLARRSASGVTANHALPLHAVYMASIVKTPNASATNRARATDIFERNIKSSAHRTWASYTERADALLQAGRQRDATLTIKKGFEVFKEAPQAWPYTITFVGRTQGWEKAKTLATECKQRFPLEAAPCTQAALSPADRQRHNKEQENKAKNLFAKLLGS